MYIYIDMYIIYIYTYICMYKHIVLTHTRPLSRRLYTNDQNVDTLLWERGGMQRTLLEEHHWHMARDDFEERRCVCVCV